MIAATSGNDSKKQNVSVLRYFLDGLERAFHLVFVEELHLWLVVILVVCAIIVYNKMINGFSLLVLFAVLYKIMQSVGTKE